MRRFLRSCQLFDVEEGRTEFKKDRTAIIDALTDHLTTRFQKVLDNPILNAMAAFDHRYWPGEKDLLEEYCVEDMELLFNEYACFFDEGSSNAKADVLEQWAALKEEIRSNKGLMSRKYHQLWAHMLEHFSEKYYLR